jgi:serine/threonine-protein kinase
MAVVYRAEDAVLGRSVALKTLHRHYAEHESFRQRFKQEARAMACLDHENVVKVYDISQEDDVPFIVAECVEGRDLGVMLSERGKGLSEEFTRRVVSQLLQGLSYAHRRGIIHRDVKPSNILLTPEGAVKVADFGIARIVEEEAAEEPGEVVGSARYMSPEQLQGKEATPRSDVYSVGIVLYHCLTGSPPFSGDLRSLIQQQLHEIPDSPRRLNRKVSYHMESVVLRALSKDPAHRYPSARAMLEDIEAEGHAEVMPQTLGIPRRTIMRSRSRSRSRVAPGLAVIVAAAAITLAAAGIGYVNTPLGQNAQELVSRALQSGTQPVQTPKTNDSGTPEAQERATGGDPNNLVPVPDVNAYYDYWARRTLVESGFEVEVVREYRDGYANRGVTWATEPAIGSMAPAGSTITIYATPKDLKQPDL